MYCILGNLIDDASQRFQPNAGEPTSSQAKLWLRKLPLVCRSWYSLFEAYLFQRIYVNSEAYVNGLFAFLLLPSTSEIRKCVRSMTVSQHRRRAHWQFLQAATSLVYLCRGSLQHLSLNSSSFPSPVTQPAQPAISWRYLTRLSTLSCLRHLEICSVKVHSFSTFLRLLGRIPLLERLYLQDIEWRTPPPIDREQWHPDCKTGFKHLRSISVNFLAHPWLFVWSFMGQLFGVEQMWSRRLPEGVVTDMYPMAHVLRVLWETARDDPHHDLVEADECKLKRIDQGVYRGFEANLRLYN